MAEGGILSVNRVLCTNSPDNEDYYDTTRQFFSSSTFSLRFSVTFLSSPLLSLFDHIFPLGGGGGGDVNSKTIIIKFLTSRNVYCILFRFIFRLKLKNTQRFGPPTHPYLYLLPQWGCDQKRARWVKREIIVNGFLPPRVSVWLILFHNALFLFFSRSKAATLKKAPGKGTETCFFYLSKDRGGFVSSPFFVIFPFLRIPVTIFFLLLFIINHIRLVLPRGPFPDCIL